MAHYNTVVVGSGPNGYAAAITLQQQGLSVLMLESEEEVGGGVRSSSLTLPGFVHDVCSAIHPLGVGSPFFRRLPLADFGLKWIYSPDALAHPLDDGRTILLKRSVQETALQLGKDQHAYQDLMQAVVRHWDKIAPDFLGPLSWPRHPVEFLRFGLRAVQSAEGLVRRFFKEEPAKALIAGIAAHAMLPLDRWSSSGVAMVLGALGHVTGWPFPEGGAQSITKALDAYFKSMGGVVETGRRVKAVADLPESQVVLFDITPRQLLQIEGLDFSFLYQQQLKNYQYGQGIFKIDWALSHPIPFKNPDCLRAATIHIGGSLEEIARAEKTVWKNQHAGKPYVLLVHQSPFDQSRAPQGQHTAWAYCHVPRYSKKDMTSVIEAQIERFAPGFRDIVLARHTMNTAELEQYNANYIGGDINGGAQTLVQLFARPVFRLRPYRTSLKDVYICSSATPPGGGVHGMCGYHAARLVIKDHFS